MTKFIAPILLTLVLTACGGGGGGGSAAPSAPISNTKSLHSVTTFAASSVRNIAVGDLNGDGLDDVVIGGWSGPGLNTELKVLIQNSDGTLTNNTTLLPVSSYAGSQRIFIRDFDNDGKNDIFIPGFNDGCTSNCGIQSIIFWNHTGQFIQQTLPEGVDSHGACVDDINGDGKLDVLVRGVYDQTTHSMSGGLYINNGNRSFTFNPNMASGATCSINHEANGNISILSGNSNQILTYDSQLNLVSSMQFASQDPAANDLIDSLSMDVNNDGSKDFVLVFDNPTDSTKGRKEVWLNDGLGNYSYSHTFDVDAYAQYDHNVIQTSGHTYAFFSGANLQAKFYELVGGQFVAYKQSRFTEMAEQANYYPGFTWSVGGATVYQNASNGKLYMLQYVNGTVYTQEM